MKTTLTKILGSALLLLGLAAATTPSAQAQAIKRDFQDWLSVQISQSSFTNDPDINGDGVDDGPRYGVLLDYLRLYVRSTGTVSGSVTVRPTADGREDVTVQIDFEDVYLGVYQLPPPGSAVRLVFGSDLGDVLRGGPVSALASGSYTLNFLQDAGAPFVNHRDVFRRGDWYASTLILQGEGIFTSAFDPAVPAGTPGLLRWGKPYRTPSANENADNGAYSQFPNDEFHLFPIGAGQ